MLHFRKTAKIYAYIQVLLKPVGTLYLEDCSPFKEQNHRSAGIQIYGGPASLSHGFKIWPFTFRGSGPSGPILFSCENISL